MTLPNPQNELLEAYTTHLLIQKYATRTIQEYTDHLKRFSNKELNQDNVNAYLKAHNYPSTRAFLLSIKEWLQLEYTIPRIKGRKGNLPTPYLTPEEIQKLIQEIPNPHISILIQLLYETGLRISEALSLTTLNISFQELTIRGIGKGQKPYEVLISQNTADKITILTEQNNENEHIFKMTRNTAWKKIHNYGATILQKQLHPHMLRHSVATELRKQGLPLETIKEYLRHTKLDTTLRYSHITDKQKQVYNPIRKTLKL